MEIRAQRLRWTLALYERDYEAALEVLDDWDMNSFELQGGDRPKSWYYGVTHELEEKPELATSHFHAARRIIERRLQANPDDPIVPIVLAGVLAHLGERESAIGYARDAMELLPSSKDALSGPSIQLSAARILIATGDYDSAIEELDAYFATPGGFWSIEGLLPDPHIDPIRQDPRFEALIEKYKRK